MIKRYDLFQIHRCGQDRRGELQEAADGEYVAFDDVAHLLAPLSTQDDIVERVAKALASIDLSRSINLTRLVDGVSEYTLTYGDGSEPLLFDDINDAYEHVRDRTRRAQAAAVTAALAPTPLKHALVSPDQERMIRDIVRAAYDRGYNDARNVSAVPGDNAPGYRGRDIEAERSDELLARFKHLAAILSPPAPAPNVDGESDGANTGVIDEYQVADPETGQWRAANPLDVMAFVERGWPVRVFLENCTLWNLVEDEMSIGRMPEPSAVPREISL